MITRNIARLMADGKGRKVEQIAEALGLTLEQARLGLEILRKHSRIRTREGTYKLTDKGAEYAAYDRGADYVKRSDAQQARRAREQQASGLRRPPKTKADVNRDYRDRQRAEQGLPPVERKPVAVVSTVERAIASRPALQALWSAHA